MELSRIEIRVAAIQAAALASSGKQNVGATALIEMARYIEEYIRTGK